MKESFVILFLMVMFFGVHAQDNNFYTLEAGAFLTSPLNLSNGTNTDLMGSSLRGARNLGHVLSIKKNFSISDKWGWYVGAGMGAAELGFVFVSTPEFNSASVGNPYAYDEKHISSSGISFFSGLAGVSYSHKIGSRSQLVVSAGPRVSYTDNSLSGIYYGTFPDVDGTDELVELFRASMRVNEKDNVQFLLDGEIFYLHRFSNSHFGFKAGISSSTLVSSGFIQGDAYLYGDSATYTAEIDGRFSYMGVSVGVVYFPNPSK